MQCSSTAEAEAPMPASPSSAAPAAEPADISSLDIRVGKILQCEKHPDAEVRLCFFFKSQHHTHLLHKLCHKAPAAGVLKQGRKHPSKQGRRRCLSFMISCDVLSDWSVAGIQPIPATARLFALVRRALLPPFKTFGKSNNLFSCNSCLRAQSICFPARASPVLQQLP
eukprot:1159507-Pelagomonas_calceolata.AAC.6